MSEQGFVRCRYCGALNTVGSGQAPTTQKFARRRLGSRKIFMTVSLAAVTIVTLSGLTFALRQPAQNKDATLNVAPQTTTNTTQPADDQPPVSKDTPPQTTTTPKTQPVTPQNPAQATLDGIVQTMNQKLSRFGVTVTLSPANNAATYSTWATLTNDDATSLQTFSSYLTEEFGKYPTDLVVNSGLKNIGLVKSLQVSGGARAAAPAPSITGMLYDVNVMVGAGSEYAREVVSHEYWHYLDLKISGSYYYDDTQWRACNPAGFSYGAGGITAYDPNSGYVAAFHPSVSFITAYSKYGIEEDRAEMFGWLIYNAASVKNLNDSGINCKTSRLTDIVHQLSPAMSF